MALERGSLVGRYVILDRVGAGAMGIVYGAFDPELDRKVAIKLLRGTGQRSEGQRARLLLEAQAMARLKHPNVVTVHDAGTHGDRVYVAMEFVEGETVRDWLAQPRPWNEELGERTRAVEQAKQAARGEGDPKTTAEIESWLKLHR
jgi:eukaryotic-like serine/threonine-protein kinase